MLLVTPASRRLLWILVGLLALAMVPLAQATLVADNGIYRAKMAQGFEPSVQDPTGTPPGQWSVMTGASFGSPAQNGKSILYDAAGSEAPPEGMETELSIKSYTSNTVYAQNPNKYGGEPNFGLVQLRNCSALTSQVAPLAVEATWNTAGCGLGGDRLAIKQRITVGSTATPATSGNSYTQQSVQVCNEGSSAVLIGIKAHWDLMVAGDDQNDKAWVSSYGPPAVVGAYDDITEDVTDFTNKVAFASTDTIPGNTFYVYGLISHPSGSLLPAAVVSPDRLVYNGWRENNYAWDVDMSGVGSPVRGDASGQDSSVNYYWGFPEAKGRQLAAGGCFTAITYITLDLAQVVDLNDPPTVTLGFDASFNSCTDSAVRFTATGLDTDGQIVRYDWDFGDGASTGGPNAGAVSHTYGSNAPVTVRVTVTDNAGATASAENTFTPPGDPKCCPVMDDLPNYQVQSGRLLRFITAARDDDSPSLMYRLEPAPPDGANFDVSTGRFEWRPTDQQGGDYNFVLQVSDGSCIQTQDIAIAVFAEPGIEPVDQDQDGVSDLQDNCPSNPNPEQADFDHDGVGNACDNAPGQDGDGVPDGPQPFEAGDYDADGVADAVDLCPFAPDGAQVDADGDGQGDACDADRDGDGVPQGGRGNDFADNCPLAPNMDQADADRDGEGDACDDSTAQQSRLGAPASETSSARPALAWYIPTPARLLVGLLIFVLAGALVVGLVIWARRE